jgi:hypothetical protein
VSFKTSASQIASMRSLVAAAFALLALALPSTASAATVGQTAPSSGDVQPCGGSTLFLTERAPYVIPGPGVLGPWSVRGATFGGSLKLKIVELAGGDTFRVVAEDPTTRTIDPNTLNTFGVRIRVHAGQLLALWVGPGSHPCAFSDPGGEVSYRGGSHPEPGIGDTFTVDTTALNDSLNASAEFKPFRCGGKNATIAGTEGSDTLEGTPNKDVIVAFGGRDTVRSFRGNDVVCGAGGKDKLKGGGGNDKLKGQKGRDKLKGGGGNDKLRGGKGPDKLVGGAGKDKCAGGKGDDSARKCEVEKSL